MKTALIALALAASPAATSGPQGDPLCNDVRALAAGAAEADPFRSLRDRDFRPRLFRGYCFFSDAGGYTCGHNLARRGETREAYAARIATCLPGSSLTRQRRNYGDELVVRDGRFEARIVEHGLDRGHVGRTINIYIASVPTAG